MREYVRKDKDRPRRERCKESVGCYAVQLFQEPYNYTAHTHSENTNNASQPKRTNEQTKKLVQQTTISHGHEHQKTSPTDKTRSPTFAHVALDMSIVEVQLPVDPW